LIGQVRVDGEPFGQQESVPAHSRVLSRCRGHDCGSAPVAHHDQAVLAAVAQALQRSRADIGLSKAAGSSGRTCRAAACSQATSAPAHSTVAPSRASITSITMPSADAPVIISLWHGRRIPQQLPTVIAALAS
jgi:hypothetical protein